MDDKIIIIDFFTNEEKEFETKELYEQYIKSKKTGLYLSLILGVVIVIVGLIAIHDLSPLFFMFFPYMMRCSYRKFGGFPENFISLIRVCILYIAAATFIYPIYKIIKEFNYFKGLSNIEN